jgi:hypothetical protein
MALDELEAAWPDGAYTLMHVWTAKRTPYAYERKALAAHIIRPDQLREREACGCVRQATAMATTSRIRGRLGTGVLFRQPSDHSSGHDKDDYG